MSIRNLSFKDKFSGIDVEVNFEGKLNIIRQKSGTGKTFLFTILRSLCTCEDIKYTYFDYETVDSSIDDILQRCEGRDVVFFDNADLYMTSELLEKLKEYDVMIIICIKSTSGLDVSDASFYFVNYTSDSISTRRRN